MAFSAALSADPHSLSLGNFLALKESRTPLSPNTLPFAREFKAKKLVAHRNQISASSSGGDSVQKIDVVYNPKRVMDEFAQQVDPSNEKRAPGLTLFSPSKINVFLRITSKRPDGYHELASLFHTISLGDTIRFSLSPSTTKDSLTTNAPGVPLDSSNLIIKALDLFRRKTGSKQYFWIHLDKRVPTGAGLGGGSGNAASALFAANQMALREGERASERELREWAGEIGSDISFFFSSGAAYCTGRGEIIEDLNAPIRSLSSVPLLLVKPKEECSTAAVYKKFSLASASIIDPSELLSRVLTEGISQDTCINDLEPPAFEVLPSLRSLKTRLSAAGRGRYDAVFMSGSGSTIVCVGDTEPPPFVYEDENLADAFISDAYFISKGKDGWYLPVTDSSLPSLSPSLDESQNKDGEGGGKGSGSLFDLKLPYSFES